MDKDVLGFGGKNLRTLFNDVWVRPWGVGTQAEDRAAMRQGRAVIQPTPMHCGRRLWFGVKKCPHCGVRSK